MKKKVALLLTIVLLVTMFIPVGVAEMAQPYAGTNASRSSWKPCVDYEPQTVHPGV